MLLLLIANVNVDYLPPNVVSLFFSYLVFSCQDCISGPDPRNSAIVSSLCLDTMKSKEMKCDMAARG
jgi:hypothetical protein